MPSFVNGGTFSASLDKWDVLTINGPGTLQVSVGTSPRFETLTFGLQNLGPYAQTALITGVMSGNGSYSVGPSNTAAGLNQLGKGLLGKLRIHAESAANFAGRYRAALAFDQLHQPGLFTFRFATGKQAVHPPGFVLEPFD